MIGLIDDDDDMSAGFDRSADLSARPAGKASPSRAGYLPVG
jgi:hypothetical protein